MARARDTPDPAKVVEAVLDVFVFAPIGFLFDARQVVPKLAERGRNQVALARLFGRYAVMRGQAEADRVLAKSPSAASPAAHAPAPAAGAPTAATGATPRPPAARTRAPRAGAGATQLAIPGYDSLSASQVVPRLDALRPEELEKIRAYEAAHRGRRTILNRIAQLQD